MGDVGGVSTLRKIAFPVCPLKATAQYTKPESFQASNSKEGVRITLTEDRKILRTRHGSKTEE